jgi:benzoyl-CoA reductase/2-hydroxyglutaryl-CoA dehydratase subunit BcrC/BadD/HgdB
VSNDVHRIELLLNEHREIVSNPRQQLEKYLAQGKKVIGCLPYFCPEELIYAAGMVPFGLWGAEMQTAEAKRYWPPFICSILQTTLELGIKGHYDKLSAVMIPMLCDSLKGMDANWRYGVKTVPVIPVAHAQNRKIPAGVAFTASQYRKIKHRLEELAGREITNSDIAKAVQTTNRRRAVMRRFLAAAGSHPELLSPSARNAVFKSSYFLDADQHSAKVAELTELLEQSPQTPWKGPKLVTSGIIADHSELLKILDDCGVAIADDQVTHESLRFRTDIPETADPIEGMAQQIGEIEGCPVLFDPGKKRGKMLIDLVRQASADGVLFVQTKFCDPEEYDYVPLKKMMDEAGIPSLLVEIDQQTANYEQVRTKLETFCEMIRS